ncbi:hypothetical protein Hte_002993 [Hypoxylon texense]
MESPCTPKRFALLVGVDFYPNHRVRWLDNGKPVSLRHLEGAVNDVKSLKELLEERFQFDAVSTLTSSAPPTHRSVPNEPEHAWPTRANIKREFDNIYEVAVSGDIFFFHFSGHGAELSITDKSPKDDRQNDPSLITADYCSGKPAIRGWELNEWLWRFNEKQVRVIVLLDSCYAGGSWRNGYRFRSPDDWIIPPNLPADETAVQGTQSKPGHRNGDQNVCWDLNPKDFTVMAACERTEMAAERHDEGRNGERRIYGAFTLALIKHFRETSDSFASTYHDIRDRSAALIALWGLNQRPQVFGQGRLAFLEGYEPISVTPILGTMEGDDISFPVGRFHGIIKGAEFITVPSKNRVIVRIDEAGDLESKARVVTGPTKGLPSTIWFIPYRWSSEKAISISLDPKLKSSFQEELATHLGDRIAGDIQYKVEGAGSTSDEQSGVAWLWLGFLFLKGIISYLWNLITGNIQSTPWFRLGVNEDGGIKISGPEQTLGVRGPVRGWNTRGGADDEKAKDTAIALAHLFRFGQIFHLRNESQGAAPFEVAINPTNNPKNPNEFEYKFRNNGNRPLYFAVLILGPAFSVKQLSPNDRPLDEVPPYGEPNFKFSFKVPNELRREESGGRRHQYRDIVRTVVTENKDLSLKSVELPDIWNADQWDGQRSSPVVRNAVLSQNVRWWIQDEQKFTS